MNQREDLATIAAVNARQQALDAIASCPLCDAAGWREGSRCNHPPQQQQEPTMTHTSPPRCRCGHSNSRHVAIVDTHTSTALSHGSCGQLGCRCSGFSLAPVPWSVRRDSVHALTAIASAGPWRVTSPRGVEVFRAPSQRTALELALSLAGVDELLARVNRLEQQQWGNHPALRTSARKSPALVEAGAR